MVSGRAPGVVIALLALEAVESTCLTAHLSSRISAMSSPLYLLDSLLGVGHHPGFPMWCLATWELAGFGNVDANDGVILGRLRATWSGPMGANARNRGGEPSFRRPTEPARH